ncbi:plasmid partitioning protein RepB C-terminal domain-containing protein [Mesorhizobium sp. WSM4906]|uniref:plasmid partitioning protein RepB C-terminal domain-containing protein n=1 Tax=Mesorhizobium sp. WSM4906 TaxID=3038546 RepID=UPI00241803A0|nr:plasmid partitioning protein RepB C-terminal domain-containing protein [Mesorhizobium sp. WSM4906]WFP74530.1 plasmid partitioning protein RepB C-terminal domain-containing protein [Mesorhizobium sp. WSM4906]
MKARGKILGLEAAYQVLQNSRTRHAALVEKMYEPARLFTGPWLCKTYEVECERTRKLTAEAQIPRDRLEMVAGAMREPLKQERFRRLLSAEGLAAVPKTLARRINAEKPSQTTPCPPVEPKPLISGISAEVLDLLQDWYVAPQVFASLRRMVPERQLKATRLMIALNRANFHYAQLLSTLTPASQLADPSRPRRRLLGVTDEQLAAMGIEFDALNDEFLYCASLYGTWALELMAARSYLDKLMENARVVRYLAQNFPDQLAKLQTILDVPMGREALAACPRKTGRGRKHLIF